MKASAKFLLMTIKYIDICHQMASLPMLYCVIFTLVFKMKHFLVSFWYRNCIDSGLFRQISLNWNGFCRGVGLVAVIATYVFVV